MLTFSPITSGICNLKFTSSDTALELRHHDGTGTVNSLGPETHFSLVKTVLQLVRSVTA